MSKLYFKIHIFNKITQNEIPNEKRKCPSFALTHEQGRMQSGIMDYIFMVINLNKNIQGFGKSVTISWRTDPKDMDGCMRSHPL